MQIKNARCKNNRHQSSNKLNFIHETKKLQTPPKTKKVE